MNNKIVTLDFISDITDESIRNIISFIMNNINSSIYLRISSTGGTISSAIAFYNYIKSNNIELHTHNSSIVGSAAIIMYLAGQKRTADKYSKFIIHPISMSWNGAINYSQLIELLQNLEIDINAYYAIMEAETNTGEIKIDKENLIYRTLYITGEEEAYKYGLITDKYESTGQANCLTDLSR